MRSVHSENGVIVLQASKVVIQISKATIHGFWYVKAILGKSVEVPVADSLPVKLQIIPISFPVRLGRVSRGIRRRTLQLPVADFDLE